MLPVLYPLPGNRLIMHKIKKIKKDGGTFPATALRLRELLGSCHTHEQEHDPIS